MSEIPRICASAGKTAATMRTLPRRLVAEEVSWKRTDCIGRASASVHATASADASGVRELTSRGQPEQVLTENRLRSSPIAESASACESRVLLAVCVDRSERVSRRAIARGAQHAFVRLRGASSWKAAGKAPAAAA
eukprot:5781569-Pleurochrysis_carterae.AAC.1